MKQEASHPNNLLQYRKRMRFSQKQVARLLGHRDTSMISRYERGHSLPPLATALSLEIILRTPVGFLWYPHYEQIRREIRSQEEEMAGRGQQFLF